MTYVKRKKALKCKNDDIPAKEYVIALHQA